MAEILRPKLSKDRPSNIPRLQSPTNPCFLASNDDQIERAQARAARASAIRRKAVATAPPPPASPSRSGLCNDQIIELFQNCIKLAAENKINQRNSWELKLIDHLSEIIKVESEKDAETNFQKASCTLEAGVKIYSLRVDSVHSEAYKVLGRITRAGAEEELETGLQDNSINAEKDDQRSGKTSGLKSSPLSTIEQSFETLNIKKFDVAFAVDPLYHHMSAQFDEGGAKGLLLNNLGVYGGCRVLFDSAEVPGTFMSCFVQNANLDTINISFAREYIEQMVANVLEKSDISPTLSKILCELAQYNGAPSHEFHEKPKSSSRMGLEIEDDLQQDAHWFCDTQVGFSDCDEESSVLVEGFAPGAAASLIPQDEDDYLFSHDDMKGSYKEFPFCFSQSMGFSPNQNVWAGPDYWKFRKPKDSEAHATERRSGVPRKRARFNKSKELDINFSEPVDSGLLEIFAPPKNGKSLLLPVIKEIQSFKLPEDCHYRPEDLVKLFLLPNVLCFGKVRAREKLADGNPWQQNKDFDDQLPSWENESACSGSEHYNDSHVGGDPQDSSDFVPHPRQVKKIEVQYDSTSKRVDVHLLKNCLWNHMQESTQVPETVCSVPLSFKTILATFPRKSQAAEHENISPHLCFICLLHLANEHGFSIQACLNLDDLSIHMPSPLECN